MQVFFFFFWLKNNNNDDFGSFLGKSQDGGIFKTSGYAPKKLCFKIKFCKNMQCKCSPYYEVELNGLRVCWLLNREGF
jgi:hypothetical protein